LNWYTNVKFTAPLIHLIKHEIVELGQKIGVPYDYICSCYYPKVKDGKIIHCKKCGCCQFKYAAFKMVQERQIITDTNDFINKFVRRYV
jgi:7-cyano-7-deazaguanine synthase in queuosine biosynthesis